MPVKHTLGSIAVLVFLASPLPSKAQPAFVPCWAQGKQMVCQSSEGPRTLFEAAEPITAAAASAEGHVVFVSGGKLWLRASDSASASKIGVMSTIARKTSGDLLSLAFTQKGVELGFIDPGTGESAYPVRRTVPLPGGIRASTRPDLLDGSEISLDGRYRVVRRPIQICENDIDSVGIQEGGATPRFDLVDTRAICKAHFYWADGDCKCMCGLGGTRWLMGGALLLSYGGGCGPGWGFEFLWRPGALTEKLDFASLSPDGRQAITDLGWIAPNGAWVPTTGPQGISSFWLSAGMLTRTTPAPPPIAPPGASEGEASASACSDATVCPAHYDLLFPHLARVCAGTFGQDDLAQLKDQVVSGAIPTLELAWLFNAYGAKGGYKFAKMVQLNTFYYATESVRWLPPSCVKARKTLSSMKDLGKQDQSMMAAIKALKALR